MNGTQTLDNAHSEPINIGGVIGCLPIRVNFDFCFECKKVTPYVAGYCFYCHSNAPLGDVFDENVSNEQWEQYFKESVLVGNMNQIDENVLSFLNSL